MAQSPEPGRFNGGLKSAHGEWSPVHRQLRVLLAEDNKINQQFATLVLNRAGHSVEVAANGNLAVEALCAAEFDVVLMDMQMPRSGRRTGHAEDPRPSAAQGRHSDHRRDRMRCTGSKAGMPRRGNERLPFKAIQTGRVIVRA